MAQDPNMLSKVPLNFHYVKPNLNSINVDHDLFLKFNRPKPSIPIKPPKNRSKSIDYKTMEELSKPLRIKMQPINLSTVNSPETLLTMFRDKYNRERSEPPIGVLPLGKINPEIVKLQQEKEQKMKDEIKRKQQDDFLLGASIVFGFLPPNEKRKIDPEIVRYYETNTYPHIKKLIDGLSKEKSDYILKGVNDIIRFHGSNLAREMSNIGFTSQQIADDLFRLGSEIKNIIPDLSEEEIKSSTKPHEISQDVNDLIFSTKALYDSIIIDIKNNTATDESVQQVIRNIEKAGIYIDSILIDKDINDPNIKSLNDWIIKFGGMIDNLNDVLKGKPVFGGVVKKSIEEEEEKQDEEPIEEIVGEVGYVVPKENQIIKMVQNIPESLKKTELLDLSRNPPNFIQGKFLDRLKEYAKSADYEYNKELPKLQLLEDTANFQLLEKRVKFLNSKEKSSSINVNKSFDDFLSRRDLHSWKSFLSEKKKNEVYSNLLTAAKQKMYTVGLDLGYFK